MNRILSEVEFSVRLFCMLIGIVAVGASAMFLAGRALRENMRFFTSELEAKPTDN